MLRIYQRLWETHWASQWQYRANLLMYLLYWVVSPVVYLSVWTSVANSRGSVNGLTANDFITYYLTLLIVDNLTSEISIHLLSYKIQDGTLSSELLLPVHPILTSTLMNNLAFKALTLIALIPVWLVLSLLVRPDFHSVTAQSVLLAVPAVVLGFFINFFMGAALTCLAFWTTRVYSIGEFYYAFVILFSGQFVPLEMMPPAVQQAAAYLPFQFFKYFPIELILNRLPRDVILRDYGMGVIWLVLSYLIFTAVWRMGLKRYSAVGA